MASLVDACPQLRSASFSRVVFTGPAFAPLQRLASLSSLTLDDSRYGSTEPDLHAESLASLPPLPTLTKLTLFETDTLNNYIAFDKGDEDRYVSGPSTLPWLASLPKLRDLQITLIAEDAAAAGEALVQHISGLQLTYLEVRQSGQGFRRGNSGLCIISTSTSGTTITTVRYASLISRGPFCLSGARRPAE